MLIGTSRRPSAQHAPAAPSGELPDLFDMTPSFPGSGVLRKTPSGSLDQVRTTYFIGAPGTQRSFPTDDTQSL